MALSLVSYASSGSSHSSHSSSSSCNCKKSKKCCKACVVVKRCSKHHVKQTPRVRPCAEHVAYLSYANVLGYKYDYIHPANTVDAGGCHFQ